MKFTVELELSEPLQEQGSRAKVGNAIADAILWEVQSAGIIPDEEDAYMETITVRYEDGDLAAYRQVI